MDSISIEIIAIVITIIVLIGLSALALFCIALRRRGTNLNDVVISSSDCSPDVCQPTRKEDDNECVKIGKMCSNGFSGTSARGWFSMGSGQTTKCSTGECSKAVADDKYGLVIKIIIGVLIVLLIFFLIWNFKKTPKSSLR